MTRATLYCVTDKEVVHSTEYNGDGYPECYGIFYIHILEKTRNIEDFIAMVQAFQYEYFNSYNSYEGENFYFNKRSKYFNKKNQMVMDETNYYRNYSSDWIFIKNLSSNPFAIITRDGDLKILQEGEQIALNYGHTEGAFKNVDECRSVHKMKKNDWGCVEDDKRQIIIQASGQKYRVMARKINK